MSELPPQERKEIRRTAEGLVRPALIRDGGIATLVLILSICVLAFAGLDLGNLAPVFLAAIALLGSVVVYFHNRRLADKEDDLIASKHPQSIIDTRQEPPPPPDTQSLPPLFPNRYPLPLSIPPPYP